MASEKRARPLWAVFAVALVYGLAVVAGAGVLLMVGIICTDILLRLPFINKPIIGAYDLVRICGAMTLAAALPYTTAIKGHVAIEYFFHKLNRTSRVVIDSLMRILSILLFAFVGWRCVRYGLELLASNQVSQTLRIPIFWVPIFIGFCSFVVVLVVTHHLAYPNREMIKP